MAELIERLKEVDALLADPELDPDLAQQLFDSAPDGIVIVNSQGLIQFVNRQALLMFGYRRVDLYDKPVEMLLPEALRERHQTHRQKFMDEPRVRPMGVGLSLVAMTREGRELPVEINLSPLVTAYGTFVAAYVRRRRDEHR